MADRSLIKGARDVYRAGMYDPANYEPLKRRFYRAADAIGRGFEMDRRRIERQHLENARRQERLETQQHQRAIAASNANIKLTQNLGKVANGMGENIRGDIESHLKDAHRIWGDCNEKRLDDPQNTAHSDCMTRQAERMENLRRDGTTFTNRHKDEDWLDKISRSNHKEKLILAEVSLATKGIDDDGNFYYDIDPDGDGITERVTEQDVEKLIDTTDLFGGKSTKALGTYILTTMNAAKEQNEIPDDIPLALATVVETLSNNPKEEYRNWKISAYDFDPSMGDSIDMTFVQSLEWRNTQNEYNKKYAAGEDGIPGNEDDPGKISPDLIDGKVVIVDEDGKNITEQTIGNWVDDREFAFGDDKKLKNQQIKWLTTGVGAGVKHYTDKYDKGNISIYNNLNPMQQGKWDMKIKDQKDLQKGGGYAGADSSQILGYTMFNSSEKNAATWAPPGSQWNKTGTEGGWFIHKSGDTTKYNEGYTRTGNLPKLWHIGDEEEMMNLYIALGLYNPGQ